MKKRTITIILGVWVALVPLLGLPNSWKNKIIVVSGILIVWAASGPSKTVRQPATRRTTGVGNSPENSGNAENPTVSESVVDPVSSAPEISSNSHVAPATIATATPTRAPRASRVSSKMAPTATSETQTSATLPSETTASVTSVHVPVHHEHKES